MHIRTRFAPSPTGFIHLGNLRSALYPWAFARHNRGDFILRIEDTDVERSTQEAVDVIIEGMAWLGMDVDEGPIYQMQRIDRYREVIKQMLDSGLAYPCYMSEDELNRLRDQQMANKEKPRYNGLWRPEPGKTLPQIPEGGQPVIRFKNPIGGSVIWEDAVKGRIEISNDELDDLVNGLSKDSIELPKMKKDILKKQNKIILDLSKLTETGTYEDKEKVDVEEESPVVNESIEKIKSNFRRFL